MIRKLHDIKRLLITVAMGAIVTLGALAQADAALSHFWVGKSYYNPAVAGDENVIHMNLGSRMQWVDFKHAPMTFYITVDMPYKLLEQRWGVGAKAEFERIGLYTNTRIGAQIAWKKRFGKRTLSVGIQPGVFSQTFRGSDTQLVEDGTTNEPDPAILNISDSHMRHIQSLDSRDETDYIPGFDSLAYRGYLRLRYLSHRNLIQFLFCLLYVHEIQRCPWNTVCVPLLTLRPGRPRWRRFCAITAC